jgi:hypothetical protein
MGGKKTKVKLRKKIGGGEKGVDEGPAPVCVVSLSELLAFSARFLATIQRHTTILE